MYRPWISRREARLVHKLPGQLVADSQVCPQLPQAHQELVMVIHILISFIWYLNILLKDYFSVSGSRL